jgi:hypothetical protein
MVNLPGRDRRRRVLKDEVFSASNNYANLRATSDDDARNAPRYSDAAGVENHPQVTDFIPRRYATIAMLVAVGAGLTTALAATQFFAIPIANATGMRSLASIDLGSSGSIGAWLSAVVLLMASATCMLTYSIRRHRIDDFRGRYRVWFLASVACLAASANSVVGFHQVAADVLSHFTGWSALRDGAVWWMALAGLPLAWITVRAMLDVRESRMAAALFVAGLSCYAMSAVSYLGLTGIADPQTRSIAVGGTLLMGHWFVLASALSYARYVVLDAQGLITVHRPKRTTKVEADKTTTETSAKPVAPVVSTVGISRSTIQTAKTPADSSRWVDGSRPERKRYQDDDETDDESSDGGSKISKADRKRLRKMKTEGRAA